MSKISVKKLSKKYQKNIDAVKEITFEIKEKSLVGLKLLFIILSIFLFSICLIYDSPFFKMEILNPIEINKTGDLENDKKTITIKINQIIE